MQLFSAVRRRELECSLQFVLLGAQAVDIPQSARLGTAQAFRRRLLLKARAGQQEMQLLVLAVQAISAERTARGPGHCVPQLGDVRGHSVEPEPPAVPALARRPVAARPALPLGRHAAQRRGGRHIQTRSGWLCSSCAGCGT